MILQDLVDPSLNLELAFHNERKYKDFLDMVRESAEVARFVFNDEVVKLALEDKDLWPAVTHVSIKEQMDLSMCMFGESRTDSAVNRPRACNALQARYVRLSKVSLNSPDGSGATSFHSRRRDVLTGGFLLPRNYAGAQRIQPQNEFVGFVKRRASQVSPVGASLSGETYPVLFLCQSACRLSSWLHPHLSPCISLLCNDTAGLKHAPAGIVGAGMHILFVLTQNRR